MKEKDVGFSGTVADRTVASQCRRSVADQHTPGPWYATESWGGAIRIHGEPDGDADDEGRSIDCTDYVAEVCDTARAEGNASLLAAAPELLDALIAADEMLATFSADAVCDHSVNICWCDFNRTRETVRAAIERATEAPERESSYLDLDPTSETQEQP